MFGGRSGTDPTGPAFADTWEWDGAAWSQPLSLQAGLVAREHMAAAYDPVRQAVAIVGGFAPSSGTDQHDQWEWSGTAWAQLSASVPALGFARVLANSGSVLTLLQSATADRAVAVLVASGPGQWTTVNPAGAVPILTAYAAAQLPGGGGVRCEPRPRRAVRRPDLPAPRCRTRGSSTERPGTRSLPDGRRPRTPFGSERTQAERARSFRFSRQAGYEDGSLRCDTPHRTRRADRR